ncbi:MAG: hypothetical protein HY789_07020 [Deltaproteobacteria bacterium]|jgi:hypothetical protein|nr:hypothetical protein [Deltaproteobacteria bacterium]
MDGHFKPGWYIHPSLALIKIYQKDQNWVYQCYTASGQKSISKERPLDQWVWALSEPSPEEY